MNKLLALATALVVGAAVTGFALAGSATAGKSVHLDAQHPRASFSLRIRRPKKILLFISSAKVAATTRCVKGTTVTTRSRRFATDGSRNLLWHIAGHQDRCRVSVSATLRGRHVGYVSVDVFR
jgi:hypothetical protein